MMSSPGLRAPAERIVAALRPHARVLFWPCVVFIALAASVGYFGGTLSETWQNLLLYVAAAIVALLLFVLPLLAWLGTRYTITTRRIIVRRGFFVRVRRELLHSRGYDVTLRRNPMQSIFRSGTISINSGLDEPTVLRDVPKADMVQSALQDLMENSQNSVAAFRGQQESTAVDDRSPRR